MDKIFFKGQVLWAQIDANRHLRHSAYADFCAQARSNMLNSIGLSLTEFAIHRIGPILFREELLYHREIHLDEEIYVEVELTQFNAINSRFSFRHLVFKADGTKSATVHVDGAWLDLEKRKLTTIPAEWQDFIHKIPKSTDYIEINE
ncbi:thioesterase family protein [Sphingobacterium sp. SRCM116780]|uniref:acyl-CoA thioesterase n=1 Tax=Sphingobacterium sp. SRCM116780 TaxID=2907623 RepID=UPI001F45A089|nr:acyl-CoA thioesterase [Sphingobacterium sp. SRCM116780]UIR54589.1 thioesterase family protein [Sphingobacterium sp. SRCM116780]